MCIFYHSKCNQLSFHLITDIFQTLFFIFIFLQITKRKTILEIPHTCSLTKCIFAFFSFFLIYFLLSCFNSGLTSLGFFSHKPNFMFTNIQKYIFFLYRPIKYFEMLAEHKSWEICRHLSAMVWMFTTCLSIHHTAHVQPRCTHAFKEYTSEPLTLQLSLIT